VNFFLKKVFSIANFNLFFNDFNTVQEIVLNDTDVDDVVYSPMPDDHVVTPQRFMVEVKEEKRRETDDFKNKVEIMSKYSSLGVRDPKVTSMILEKELRVNSTKESFKRQIAVAKKKQHFETANILEKNLNESLNAIECDLERRIKWYERHGNMAQYEELHNVPEKKTVRVKNIYKVVKAAHLDSNDEKSILINASRDALKKFEKLEVRATLKEKEKRVSDRRRQEASFSETMFNDTLLPKKKEKIKGWKNIEDFTADDFKTAEMCANVFIDDWFPEVWYHDDKIFEEPEDFSPAPIEVCRSYAKRILNEQHAIMVESGREMSLQDIIKFNRSALFKARENGNPKFFVMKSTGQKLEVNTATADKLVAKMEKRMMHKLGIRTEKTQAGCDDLSGHKMFENEDLTPEEQSRYEDPQVVAAEHQFIEGDFQSFDRRTPEQKAYMERIHEENIRVAMMHDVDFVPNHNWGSFNEYFTTRANWVYSETSGVYECENFDSFTEDKDDYYRRHSDEFDPYRELHYYYEEKFNQHDESDSSSLGLNEIFTDSEADSYSSPESNFAFTDESEHEVIVHTESGRESSPEIDSEDYAYLKSAERPAFPSLSGKYDEALAEMRRKNDETRANFVKDMDSFHTFFDDDKMVEVEHPMGKSRSRFVPEIEFVIKQGQEISFKKRMETWLHDVSNKSKAWVENTVFGVSQMLEGLMTLEEFLHPMAKLEELVGPKITNAVKDILSISCLVYLLHRSRTYLDVSAVVVSYLMGHGIDPMLGIFKDVIDKISSLFYTKNAVFTEAGEELSDFEVEKGFSLSQQLTSAAGFMNTLFNSEFALAIRTLVLSVVALKWVPIGHVKKIYNILGKPAKMTIIDIITSLLESLGSLVGIAESVERGVPFSKYVMNQDPVTMFFIDGEEALRKRGRVYVGAPVPGKHCQEEYRRQLGVLLVCGNDLLKRLGNNPFETRKQKLKKLLENLGDAAYEIDEYVRTHERTPPIIFVLHGDPSVGKGFLVAWILNVYSRTRNWKFENGMLFSKGRETDYWEGYDPSSMPFILMSELGNTSNVLSMREVDKELISLQSLCDSLPFICNMAFLEKGKIYADPKVVIVDTNNPDLHLDKQVFCEAAFKRRIWYLHVRVKTEFTVSNGTAIDKKKSLEAGGNILDRYLFSLTRYTANGNKAVVMEDKSFGGLDIYDATLQLHLMMKEHIETNAKVKELINYNFVDEVIGTWGATKVPLRIPDDFKEGYPMPDIRIPEEPMDLAPAFSDFYLADVFTEAGYEIDIDDPRFRALGPDIGSRIAEQVAEIQEAEEHDNGLLRQAKYYRTLNRLESWKESWGAVFLSVAMVYAWVRDFITLLLFCLLLFVRTNLFGKLLFKYFFTIVSALFLWAGMTWAASIVMVWSVICAEYIAKKVTYGYIYLFERFCLPKLKSKIDWYMLRLGLRKATTRAEQAVYRDLYHPYNFVKCAGAVVLIGAIVVIIKKFYANKRKVVTEGLHHSTFERPSEFDEDIKELEIVDGVGKNMVHPVHSENPESWNKVHLQRLSNFTGDPLILYQKLSRNLRRVAVRKLGEKIGQVTYGLGVCGTYMLINKHIFGKNTVAEVEIYQGFDIKPGEKGQKIVVNVETSAPIGVDFLMINTVGQHFHDIKKHFVRGKFESGQGIIRGEFVRVKRHSIRQKFCDDEVPFYSNDYFIYKVAHHPGMCGLPLIANVDTKGWAIIALHSGGVEMPNLDSYGLPVEMSDIEHGCDFLDHELGPKMKIFSEGAIEKMQMPKRKSAVRHIDLEYLHYEGSTGEQVNIHQKSKIMETPYTEEADEFIEKEFDFHSDQKLNRPLMEPMRRNGEYIDPYINGLRKMNIPTPYLKEEIMDVVILRLTERIVDGLKSKGVKKLCPISFLEAVNGVEQDTFIKRINASTSGAYGWPGPKSTYMPLNADGVTREPTEALRRDCLKILRSYEREETANPLHKVQLKDEPREQSKCESGATRLFYMSPLDHLIVCRMYLAPFYSCMVANGDVFCAGLGFNMLSDGDKIAKKLRDFSDYFLEGDYSGFDVSFSGFISWMWSSVVLNVLREFGYNESALKKVQGILSDSIYPMITLLTDVFMKFGMVLSGKYATAESNTGGGLCMLMYAWYANPLLADKDFFEYVLPLLYGDDFLVGIKRGCEDTIGELFNNLTYQRDCKEYFNMKITPSQKDGVFEKFLSFDNISFLKRNFVWHDLYGKFVAPLSLNSIRKSLMWYMPSVAVTREHQTIASLSSSLWELFLHCKSRDQFENVRNYFCGLLERHFGNTDGNLLFPTYFKIGSTTRLLQYSEDDKSESFYPDGDGSTVSCLPAGELSAFKDLLIPSFEQENGCISVFNQHSQNTNSF